MHRRPRQAGGFSVLKAPDIPSVLIELGFMSAPRDLGHLRDQEWRSKMAEALVVALQVWAADEAARAGLLRR
jgi:N-acetylmuramoyl-L-alanine amidase